jgi:hypothetical protein
MANEAVKVELTNSTGFQRRFTVADSAGIAKGSLLKLTDPRTAAQSDGTGDPIAGIAAMEKVAYDGSTSISVYTDGIFEMLASGAIILGQPVKSAANVANSVMAAYASSAASGAQVIGYCMETAADGETVNIRVRL